MNKYFIITYGCQMNKADSERIAASLEKKGYKIASDIKEADLIVVNMCSVRQTAVDRVFGLGQKISKLKLKNPKIKIILTGCITKSDKKKFAARFDEIVNKEKYLNCVPKYQNLPLAYIPISNGCNNACTYCVVPFARGSLICRNYKLILKEVKNAISKKAEELWFLGQNVNDYQYKKTNFAKLLKIVNEIPGDFRFFFTSPHPKNFSDELIKTLAECSKFGRRLNLPVQSGDNKILKLMNRPYMVEQYKTLVKKIRKAMPDINLSTDAIVGFPGETKPQFENTVKLFKEICFDMAYIAKFSPRPGTLAFKMKDGIPYQEKERRWKILNDIILKKMRKKMVVVLGPTAVGKSALAVKLAKKFKGEIISADSRQVYKGMSIGTGKITGKEMQNIPHYLLDVASPRKRFTVTQYRELALKAIEKIFAKGKVPILCGGTGFYLQAVIDGIIIPEVKPDWQLRSKLEKFTTEKLYKKLKKLDSNRAKTIDKNNRRRLIRALEIVLKTKKPVPALKLNPLPYPVLIIGLKKEKTDLKKLIEKRFYRWLKQGLIGEVKILRKSGLSWKKIEAFGIHYRIVAQYLEGKINYQKMMENSLNELNNYAKRQITWFKRDKRIQWIKKQPEAEKLVKEFLKK